jgi:hypothetical protein
MSDLYFFFIDITSTEVVAKVTDGVDGELIVELAVVVKQLKSSQYKTCPESEHNTP